jgi:Trk-type K+ transport system membrane component
MVSRGWLVLISWKTGDNGAELSPTHSFATATTACDRVNNHQDDSTFEEVPIENPFAGNSTNSNAPVSTVNDNATTTALTSKYRLRRWKRVAIFALVILLVIGFWTIVGLVIFRAGLKHNGSGGGGAKVAEEVINEVLNAIAISIGVVILLLMIMLTFY